ncbi:hypothetical protein LP422_15580 [Janibacter limosus]|uniref:Uncharacterized protein n=1 Tax=Janibacter limosus TaxID=53458 RepID=A0AC61U203_9MICO|nr:hypothetical protein [Janibacter limosus]UUZ44039.1 hypothetical protein LP422_15580 [Janibacter limosus]
MPRASSIGEHLDLVPPLAESTDEGTVSEEQDARLHVIALGKRVHLAHRGPARLPRARPCGRG